MGQKRHLCALEPHPALYVVSSSAQCLHLGKDYRKQDKNRALTLLDRPQLPAVTGMGIVDLETVFEPWSLHRKNSRNWAAPLAIERGEQLLFCLPM